MLHQFGGSVASGSSSDTKNDKPESGSVVVESLLKDICEKLKKALDQREKLEEERESKYKEIEKLSNELGKTSNDEKPINTLTYEVTHRLTQRIEKFDHYIKTLLDSMNSVTATLQVTSRMRELELLDVNERKLTQQVDRDSLKN